MIKQIISFTSLSLAMLSSSVSAADSAYSAVSSSQCQLVKGTSKPFILALKKGEQVQSAILQCAQDANLAAASLSGLGAFQPVTVRYYDHQQKAYHDETYANFMEVTNLSGNITFMDSTRQTHIHVTLSDENFMPKAGHLKDAIVGAVLEVLVTPLPNKVVKVHDDETGLNIIQTH